MLDRINTLLIENGLSDKDLATIAGVGKSTVSGWRNGKYSPKKDKLQKIADYFGTSVDWLVGVDDYRTKGEQKTIDILFESKAQRSHSRELFEVSAGSGRINGDYPADMSDDIDYGSGEYVDAVIHGDSMYPIIMDGDIITIHLQKIANPDPKRISVVKVDGESTTVKYVELVANGLWIRAENKSAFEDRFYTIADIMNLPIKVLGTVVAVKRRL